MGKKIGYSLLLFFYLAGCAFIWYPVLEGKISQRQEEQAVQEFQEKRERAARLPQEDVPEEEVPFQQLKEEMETYNRRIYEEKQRGLVDAWSYEQSGISMEGYPNQDPVGYLRIDKMGIRLPLYLGASKENMAKGAAVLGQTSMPVGGTNTNCVVAAHRGYRGTPMFRDIELLEIGDRAVLSNLWGDLQYEVYRIEVILPNQIDKIKIQEGGETLTLLTCHPYSQNYQRYAVYLRRIDEGASNPGWQEERREPAVDEGEDAEPQPVVSSQQAIREEQILTGIGITATIVMTAIILIGFTVSACKKRKKRR